MRLLLLLILLASISFAQVEPEITRFLHIEKDVSCPDNMLTMQAVASDGKPAPGVELRLVLHYPYQGLRAVQTTDSKGIAKAKLTKPGNYRIYIRTDDYNHDDFEEFDYPEMCPPPPPKGFNVTVGKDCNNSQLIVTATEEGDPLEDVFISTEKWSSTSNPQGIVVFPLEEGLIYITANRSGYSSIQFWADINCTPPPPPPPPECLQDQNCSFDQFCENETCINITGECGYPENHSWVSYECCEDEDCGFRMICRNNTCEVRPPPPENITQENETEIVEKPGMPDDNTLIVTGALIILLVVVIVSYKIKR